MKEENIENTIIYKFCMGGDIVTIIVETAHNKVIFNNDNLLWHIDNQKSQYLTLKEILKQFKEMGYKSGVITVWQETPLNGEIYQYGNHYPASWIKIGQTIGYA